MISARNACSWRPPLAEGARITLAREQAHYLLNVLRMREGEAILVFNGRDGEWRATLAPEGRKAATLCCEAQTRPQPATADLHYLFAPLKAARWTTRCRKRWRWASRGWCRC